MARLNTSVEPSSSVRPSPSTRENSLYRLTPSDSQTPQPEAPHRPNAYSPSASSDKENQGGEDSEGGRTPTQAQSKRKGKSAMGPPTRPGRNGAQPVRMPLSPDTGEHNIPLASQLEDTETAVENLIDLQFYDPDQNPTKRRKLRQDLRENIRNAADRRDELLQPDNTDLLSYIARSDRLMQEVRQTSDATIDSRFLVSAGDLALRKATEIVKGDVGSKIDTDEFVSKCMTFMRNKGPVPAGEEPTNTQARRRQRQSRAGVDEDEDEDEDDGEGLDWAVLGELACFPNNKRPPVPGFLLGPLSVQKRARVITRRARQQRTQVAETRPDELKAQDLQQAENSNLTSLCREIRELLKNHIKTESEALTEELDESATDAEVKDMMRKYRIAKTPDEEAAVSLFDFAINPHSFGQTVENLFYISFIIREGTAGLVWDEDGLPLLEPTLSGTAEDKRTKEASKYQAIFSIDYETYSMLVDAFDIKEPLIPHRRDAENPIGTGWYTS